MQQERLRELDDNWARALLRMQGHHWEKPASSGLAALGAIPARLHTPLLFPAPGGGLLHVDNFRRREWTPAITASGVDAPAQIYDLRSTFASRALAAGVSAFELARVMGTSVQMIERHYGTLLDGAGAGIVSRLDTYDAEQEQSVIQVPRERAGTCRTTKRRR